MIKIISPGLPAWPPLMFDRQTGIAEVNFRHPTWRSYESAIRATNLGAKGANLLFAIFLVNWIPVYHWALVIVLVLVIAALTFPIVKMLMQATFKDFLARQVFASVTWFEASIGYCALRSDIHEKPIVIWRDWQGKTVRVRFIVQQDPEAASVASNLPYDNRRPRGHLNEAMHVEGVLSVAKREEPQHSPSDRLQRSVPLLECSSRYAAKITVVLSAALAIAESFREHRDQQNVHGTDIDLGQSIEGAD